MKHPLYRHWLMLKRFFKRTSAVFHHNLQIERLEAKMFKNGFVYADSVGAFRLGSIKPDDDLRTQEYDQQMQNIRASLSNRLCEIDKKYLQLE
jgi:hypothetical protein